MILDFNSFRLNESSLKKLKKEIRGVLNMSDRKRMRKELRHNIITFKFRKRNGDLRTARGTLHPDYLPPLRGGGPRPEKQMVYFDLDKGGWRSFRSYSFIKITDIKSIDDDKPKHSKPIEKEDDEEIKKVHTRPTEKHEEEVEKVHKEDSEKESHKSEVSSHKPEHKEEDKKVHKEPEDIDSKEDDSEKDEEAFTKKKSFTHTEHKEKDEHSDEDKEKDEDD